MRLSRLLLHVGTHKTGSTAIQDTFYANSELLAARGIVYPRLSIHTGHHGLVTDWVAANPAYVLPEGSRAALRRIAETWGEGDHTVVLSSEEFSRGQPGNSVDLSELRALLSAFDQVEVLCVLRTQWQFLQSVYLEVAKSRAPGRPENWVREAIGGGMVQGLWVDYTRLLDRLEGAFAPAEIRLLDYTTASRAPGGLIGAVLSTLGTDLRVEDLALQNGGVSNASPLALASMSANLLSEPAAATPAAIERATRLFRELAGSGRINSCIFTQAEFDRIAEHFRPLNALLEERRSAWQPGFRLSPPDASAITHFRDGMPAGYWLQMSRALLKGVPAG